MSDMTRRSFMGLGAAVAATAAIAGNAVAEEAPAAPAEKPFDIPSVTGWTGTPAELLALGTSTMPLADLNNYRKAYLETQTDYTMADGTVIPACFVKVRALIHTYGIGCGNELDDSMFGKIMRVFSEDDAAMFLAMPMGRAFSAMDLFAETGRPQEECAELLDRLAYEGFLCKFEGVDSTNYFQVPWFQGVVEYNLPSIAATGEWGGVVSMASLGADMAVTGTPTFRAIPCSTDVVADETILPYDNFYELVKGKKTLAIAPCYDRFLAAMAADPECPTLADFCAGTATEYRSPVNGHRVETCLMMNSEAEHWIEAGMARQITAEEAVGYLERGAEDGWILMSAFGRDADTICMCHPDAGCGILTIWSLSGNIAGCVAHKQASRYDLVVDLETCAKCGMCAQRCPIKAITMDEETGLPVVGPDCFRCGQCGYTCPTNSRKLVARDQSLNAPLPKNFLDDNNIKAAYRFEMGHIH